MIYERDYMFKKLELLLKSLHVCTKLPIILLDCEYDIIKEYRSDCPVFFYNYKSMLNEEIINEISYFYFLTGHFNEMFISYLHKDITYLFGPFRVNIIDKEFFLIKMNRQKIPLAEQEELYCYLKSLPLFSLGDIRDVLTLIHYFFTGKVEDLLHNPLCKYLKEIDSDIKSNNINFLISQSYDSEMYLFLYENKIYEYIKNGDYDKLKNIVFKLKSSP